MLVDDKGCKWKARGRTPNFVGASNGFREPESLASGLCAGPIDACNVDSGHCKIFVGIEEDTRQCRQDVNVGCLGKELAVAVTEDFG
jgi:hypothetical protein